MNNVITKTNVKGQFVLPIAMRKALGIDENTHLHVSLKDRVITIEPFTDIVVSQRAKNLAYLKILKSTQGAWVGDNWPEQEKEIDKREIKATDEMRNAW